MRLCQNLGFGLFFQRFSEVLAGPHSGPGPVE
jgi:hypothetical protein